MIELDLNLGMPCIEVNAQCNALVQLRWTYSMDVAERIYIQETYPLLLGRYDVAHQRVRFWN